MKKWLGAVTALGMALTVAACGSGSGAKAAPQPTGVPTETASPLGDGTSNDSVPAALWAKWGLKPLLPAPAPPADKPVKLSATGKVPVISHIPTTDKVVFITLDDGAEKDPRFVKLMEDLKIPVTMFLTKDIIKNDYGYFKPLQALGNRIENHTVSHPPMNTISLAAQKQQVCEDQKTLTSVYGTAPYLFRPPYGAGAYTGSLNTAVQACGPRAIILWKETMQITGFQYQAADRKLRPGDIILAHFRGPSELKGESMVAMFVNMVKRIEEQGFSVARLEDYIAPPA
ncbi:polysaccharide deacetylase family protein [Streptacidiphilus jiangxiensis]|uniref:Peptidoglycan/xylan/chitin deacetylase, PgdA/CDA1 family n=1 Tax=Streptacidiphilus jiangxiensis TaxID=235985 RepID=A0A1H7M8G4_STRJI|nr:polysaccharide deacetylase family protein [Streptacidiphilus jiangxiensis]SEL07411.1 Peptidoglycan/xylan/chitin deacetylase, PgdA/CDA1 family [Streptacidiphilus jiangxiensis]